MGDKCPVCGISAADRAVLALLASRQGYWLVFSHQGHATKIAPVDREATIEEAIKRNLLTDSADVVRLKRTE